MDSRTVVGIGGFPDEPLLEYVLGLARGGACPHYDGEMRACGDRRVREVLQQLAVVITRVWRGWTANENADAYEAFLLTELFPTLRAIPGFLGADVLRRTDGDEVAFVTLTRFDTLDAIRTFAGEEYDTPVLEPTARALLSRHDPRAQHFETSSFEV